MHSPSRPDGSVMAKFRAPLLLLLLYWGTRLWQLLSLPIFLDEGTYITRAFRSALGIGP